MASSINVIIKTIINLFIYYNCLNLIKFVNTSRADLGTYLHISPAIEEKQQSPEELYVLAFINYTFISDGREVYYSEEKGRYGEGKILNVQGFLEHITSVDDVNDHTACTSQIRGTNGNPLPASISISSSSSSSTSTTNLNSNLNKPWIALIKRGKCTFEEKIKHAWKHGAVGVIVYNEIPAVSLEKMKIIEKDRNITAIFTYKWIGEELGRIVDEGNHIWVSISEGQRGMRPHHNINKTSVLFVSISFIVLMIISLVWLIFYYIQRFRYLQSKDQHSRHLCAVAKRVIMKIPTKSGKTDDKDNDNDCCAICIEPYKATDCIRVLPCNHEFHKNCIDPWLLEHRTCPMCKLDVLKHYGFVCTLHRHCPAQADRVFWEVFPNRYFGSEESILQLDLDMEIGDHGLNSGDDDRFSIDNPRISHTTPTFHIETFDDHSHLVRNISSETSSNSQRLDDLPERSQSSLSCINRMLDDAITNKLFPHNQQFLSRNLKDNKNSTTTTTTTAAATVKGNNSSGTSTNSNFLSPDVFKKDKESVSLPGTLKKKRSSDTCRGSNNCYIKNAANDLKQLAAKIEKGCPKSRTTIVRQASDDEHLLDNDDCTTATNDPNTIPPAVALSSSSSSSAATAAASSTLANQTSAASSSSSDTPSQIRIEITPTIDGENEQQHP